MKNILLVEDDEYFRSVLTNVLKDNGFQVEQAQNGQEAKHILDLRKIDIVISDIKMPIINGIELLKFIKNSEKKVCVTPIERKNQAALPKLV